MRSLSIGILLTCLVVPVLAQNSPQGPSDKKAQKSYRQALEHLQKREPQLAIWYFRDADKLDHGRCLPCQEQMVQVGLANHDWKAVQDGASGMAGLVSDPKQQAVAHHYIGLALMNQGLQSHQNDLVSRAHNEFAKALALQPYPDSMFEDGKALAQLHRDDEAKAQFQKYVALSREDVFNKWRARQFVANPELARSNLVPNFGGLSADGTLVNTRNLAGKVVLVYFWATSCDVCLRAWPHLRAIAKKFQNQPFVILNVSTDYDNAAWRTFLQKNDIPGLQFQDGFNGPIARAFGVNIELQSNVDQPTGNTWVTSHGVKEDIPKTFTIDSDGVFQSEKMSDSLDAKLQDLISRAGHQAK
ncbi:MAG TPA: TlpA disulfide reductase family protein [Candidatus Sulfotelmatobacter sp.]|nr:TlpA disulfide reductase family protein [Candidatus Sulfotelmatobacter sp.]